MVFSNSVMRASESKLDDAMTSKIYALQTKILEGRTKDWVCLFQALFNGVGALFGRRTIGRCLDKTVQTFCSAFQNLRLGTPSIVASKKSRTFAARISRCVRCASCDCSGRCSGRELQSRYRRSTNRSDSFDVR